MNNLPPPSRWLAADLAPGDRRSLRLDTGGLVLRSVESAADPAFAEAYEFLAVLFQAGGLERREVLAERLAWPRGPQADGYTLRYELLCIRDAAGRIAAVRDHTALVPPGARPAVVIHLSHALIAAPWRRSGLGGWLRALPLQIGREALEGSGQPAAGSVTLVAEMEEAPEPGAIPANLLAYERAWFRKLPAALVPYAQPDFRSAAEIDAAGGPRPLPFSLVIRQVGREQETELDGGTVRSLARALYRIYRDGCRVSDLAPLAERIESHYPCPGERVPLVAPTAP